MGQLLGTVPALNSVPMFPPGYVTVEIDSPQYQELCAAYSSLPKPPVLATGQPNTWLLEYTVQKHVRDTWTANITRLDGSVSCLGRSEMWLWDADQNAPAMRLPAHLKQFWGSITLITTATDRSARSIEDIITAQAGDLRVQAVIELCSSITNLIVPPFAPEEMFPEQFQRNKRKNADRSPFHLGVTPHTILVYDRTLADILNRTGMAGLLENPPHFVAIPFRRGRLPMAILSGESCTNHKDAYPIPVICAHCKVIGVTNPGPLGEAFKVLNRCASCSTTWYCSKQCQREDWYNGHKVSCVKVDSKLTKVPTVCDCGNKI